MKTARIVFVAAVASLALSLPATAQRTRAPIQQGVTSSDLASTTQQLQQANAQLRLQLGDMVAENAAMTGKVETLEFLLSQTRDEINRMQGDDQEIAKQLSSLRKSIDTMNTKIKALEARPAAPAGNVTYSSTPDSGISGVTSSRSFASNTSRPSTTTPSQVVVTGTRTAPTTRTVTTSGPRSLTANTGSAAGVMREAAITSPPPQTGSLGTISASKLPGEAGPLFTEAKSRLLQFDYAGAEVAFRSFLSAFGDDPQAGEAQYWLGEALFQQDAYGDSGAAFSDMIRNYPDDARAPDALVKLSRAMRLTGDTTKACAALNMLPARYPDASSVTNKLADVERTRSGC